MVRFFGLVFREGHNGNVSSHHVVVTRGNGRYFEVTSFVTFSQIQVVTRNASFISCPEVSRNFITSLPDYQTPKSLRISSLPQPHGCPFQTAPFSSVLLITVLFQTHCSLPDIYRRFRIRGNHITPQVGHLLIRSFPQNLPLPLVSRFRKRFSRSSVRKCSPSFCGLKPSVHVV